MERCTTNPPSTKRDARTDMSDNFLPAIVIVGSERSGTNLLRALLSTHSRIASPPPAGFIERVGRDSIALFSERSPALPVCAR